jgi:hypothetical protein
MVDEASFVGARFILARAELAIAADLYLEPLNLSVFF